MATERDLRQVAMYNAPESTANGSASAKSLLGGIVGDLQELVRKEIALAREETVEESRKVKVAAVALASAGAVLAIGGLFLLVALGGAVADLIGWPYWTGYAIVGVILCIVGALLVSKGLKKIKHVHPVPEKTVATVKENVEWLKERTTGKV